jgi:hypothetical protein
MKKNQLFVLFFLGTVVAVAQTQDISGPPSTLFYHSMAQDARIEELFNKRFFNDSLFRQGELRTRKALFTTELGYRFDQVEQTIEVKTTTGKQLYLEPKDVLYCKLFFEDHTVVFMPVPLPKKKNLTLVQVVYKTPSLQLYRDIRKKIINSEPEKDYRYYIRKDNKESLKEVEINEKSLVNILPHKRSRITKFFKGKKKEDMTLSQVVHLMGELDEANKPDN